MGQGRRWKKREKDAKKGGERIGKKKRMKTEKGKNEQNMKIKDNKKR